MQTLNTSLQNQVEISVYLKTSNCQNYQLSSLVYVGCLASVETERDARMHLGKQAVS